MNDALKPAIGIGNGVVIGVLAWWAILAAVLSMTGCATLPQTYRVPLIITQDATHRLPYSDITR